MSIASEITRLQQAKADIKTAIENKGVTVPSSATLDAYDGYIDDIPSGGGTSLEDKPVIYIDYDGTVLYGYTAEEFAQLTEHPANPDHSGDDIPLTSQGWNWTLSDAKTYVASKGYLVIGQMYITTDGATYIGIDTTLTENKKFTTSGITVYFNQNTANGVSVDFGDGTTPQTVSGTGDKTLSHTYATDGQYVIKFTPVSGLFTIRNPFFGSTAWNDRYNLLNAVTFIRFGGSLRTNFDIGRIGNYNIETITFPENARVGTVAPNGKFKTLVIPSGHTSVGCFNYCMDLKYVSIPKSVTDIVADGFARCFSLKIATLPDIMNSLGNQVFNSCTSIERIVMPTTLTSFGTNLFASCANLKHVNIPTNLKSIPYLGSCYILETITLPSNTETIDGTFINCYNLRVCDIPSTLKTLGNYAFRYCYKLERMTIPSGVTSLPSVLFQNCYKLKELIILGSITKIPEYSFQNCYELAILQLPSTLTSIDKHAFSSCYNLKNITIPNNVTTIGDYAFMYCSQVETITIGEKVTSIGIQAFYNHTNMEIKTLQAIYMLPEAPPTITSNTFSNNGTAFTIYVPNGKLTAYQTASNWTAFASQMVEMSSS